MKKRFNISVNEQVMKKLKVWCIEKGKSVSSTLEMLIQKWLKEEEKK